MDTVLWEGVLGIEGEMTGDGRLIEKGALRWENLPVPIRYVPEDNGAHDGAYVVGHTFEIERITTAEANERLAVLGQPSIEESENVQVIWGKGDFDAGSDVGREAARVVGDEITNGVSMDLDDVSFEVRVAAELLDGMMAEEEMPEPDEDGLVKVMEMGPDDEVMVTTSARVRAETIVAIPAFASARIAVVKSEPGEASDDVEDAGTGEDEALVASAGRKKPPAEWFLDPKLEQVTPLTVTPEGRVYGHVAAWNTCHISHTAQGQCIQPPHSNAGYAYFHVGAVETADGRTVAVGKLTVNTRHAGRALNAVSTLAHYEDTGNSAALVRAGEDAHGIWVAGCVDPHASDKQVHALKSSPISGDWRNVGGGGLELVAVLAVNTPGFPIPRPSGLAAGGALQSLVASGMVPPRRVARPGTPNALSDEDLRYLKDLARRERNGQLRARAQELAVRVRGPVPERAARLAARVAATKE